VTRWVSRIIRKRFPVLAQQTATTLPAGTWGEQNDFICITSVIRKEERPLSVHFLDQDRIFRYWFDADHLKASRFNVGNLVPEVGQGIENYGLQISSDGCF